MLINLLLKKSNIDDTSIIYNDSIKDYIYLTLNSNNCFDISNIISFDFKSLLNFTIILLE